METRSQPPLDPPPGAQTRRGFVRRTLLTVLLLSAAGAVPVALRSTRPARPPRRPLRFFSLREYAIFAAVADRLLAEAPGDPDLPGGPLASPAVASAADLRRVPRGPTPAEVDVAGKADAFLEPLDAGSAKELKQLLALFENALFSLATLGPPTPFTQQTPAQQDRHLAAWAGSRLAVRRTGYQALKRLACAIYYASPEVYASVGYPGPPVELVRSVLQGRRRTAR